MTAPPRTPASAPAGAGRVFGRLPATAACLAGAFLVAGATTAAPYRDGPPPGFSGGFGEQSCHACHFEGEIDEAPGSLAIEGVPEAYAPGETYPLTLTLTRPGMAIGGFQLTARFEEGGAQAGALAIPSGEEARVRVTADQGVQYAYHLHGGTILLAPDTARWTLLWTAPDGRGNVLFHAAGNAADEDDTISGDHVYTAIAKAHAGAD